MAPLVLAAIKIAAGYVPELIGKMAGGDAQNVAAKVVEIAQAVTGSPDPDSALAVLNADPAKVLEFKQAVLANEAAIEQAYLADMQSARQRDIEFVKAGQINYRANALAGGAVVLVIFCLFITVWSSDMDDFAKATITLICGRALGWVEQVFSFEFGTTRSSSKKDDTIKNLSK